MIQAANPDDDKWRVDDEKIKRLVERKDGNVSLTLNEIVALERFFSQQGEGANQKGFFERNMLDPIAHSGRVCFILGAAKDGDGVFNVVRRWDTQALAEIITVLTSEHGRLEVEVKDEVRDGAHVNSRLDEQVWHQYLHRKQTASSLISIGSPLANPASECILAAMCCVQPFVRPKQELPFYFVWPSQVTPPFPSAFALTVSELENRHMAAAKWVKETQRGLLYLPRDKTYLSTRLKENGKAHALLVGQRRVNGQVLLVVAGVSGPGTLGAARFLASESFPLPEPISDERDGNVWAGIVAAEVRRQPHHRGDEAEVSYPELVKWFELPGTSVSGS